MKTWKLAAVAVGVIFLAGCGNKAAENKQGAETQSENKQAAEIKTETQSQEGGIINSIKDAMNLGKTMKCTYSMKAGGGNDFVSVAYIQGKKYKATNEMAGRRTISLFDEKTIYTWVEGEKTGTKMEMSCMEELSKSTPEKEEKTGVEAPLDSKVSDEEAFKNAMDVKCEDASNVDFSVPSDVIFTDQCEMMKGMMDKINSTKVNKE